MTRDELALLFQPGAPVRAADKKTIIGRGIYESDLAQMGLEKRELKKLAAEGLIHKVTTIHNNAWRNVWVFRCEVPESEIKEKTA